MTGKKQQTEVRRRKGGRRGKGSGSVEGRRRLQAASLTVAERAVPAAAAAGRQSLLYSWDLKEELKRAEKGEGDPRGLVTGEEDGTLRARQPAKLSAHIMFYWYL